MLQKSTFTAWCVSKAVGLTVSTITLLLFFNSHMLELENFKSVGITKTTFFMQEGTVAY